MMAASLTSNWSAGQGKAAKETEEEAEEEDKDNNEAEEETPNETEAAEAPPSAAVETEPEHPAANGTVEDASKVDESTVMDVDVPVRRSTLLFSHTCIGCSSHAFKLGLKCQTHDQLQQFASLLYCCPL